MHRVGNDEAFFQAVSVAGMILENKFERYRGNERADRRVEEILEEHRQAVTSGKRDSKMQDTDFTGVCTVSEAVVGDGDCICHIPIQSWWILYTTTEEGIFHELQMQFSGRVALVLKMKNWNRLPDYKSAGFCHKGGFLMTVGMLEDAVKACRISMELYHEIRQS